MLSRSGSGDSKTKSFSPNDPSRTPFFLQRKRPRARHILDTTTADTTTDTLDRIYSKTSISRQSGDVEKDAATMTTVTTQEQQQEAQPELVLRPDTLARMRTSVTTASRDSRHDSHGDSRGHTSFQSEAPTARSTSGIQVVTTTNVTYG